ncbi:MAG: ATP-binding cassette domain-containing protein [Bacteroidetes bacterium]|nr:ATP-binding cassette domain-containing protein [Bacteroidota bacterium]
MGNNSIIKVEGLSKHYLLNKQSTLKSDTLYGNVINGLKNLKNITQKRQTEDFWALQDVSFEIQQGDRVGVIGRNGAGKSTLLKILSRITPPTKGRVEINGRLASLLEVGTGFHGDLSGRENIYLNGSILGMSKADIDRKFDEIVSFSEIEAFIDTPVKRYSSGMYVRLAFSVAAHLEQEILILDEVLAVGDSIFQKKCIDKLNSVSKEGRTVLFVSHNFAAIESLCNTAILLEKGRLVAQGSVMDVFNNYNSNYKMSSRTFNLLELDRTEHARQLLFSKIVFDEMPIRFGSSLNFYVQFKSVLNKKFKGIDIGINICNQNYQTIYHVSNRFINSIFDHDDDDQKYRFEIENNLKPGDYFLILFLRADEMIQDVLMYSISFEILDGNPYGFEDSSQLQGAVLPKFKLELLK